MPNPIPRAEHPRPQLYRPSWFNLNGAWDFTIDFSCSGLERKFWEADVFDRTIIVPFCPESPLSGIGFTDFMPAVWYKRIVELDASQLNGRTLLHFGAVDYDCRVFINGTEAGQHKGGYASFCFDITTHVKPGSNTIVVYAKDDNRSGKQPRGKQCEAYRSQGCDYTRTTGIWQTVWLEFVPETYITRYKLIPDPANAQAHLTVQLSNAADGCVLQAEASMDGAAAGKAEVRTNGNLATLTLSLDECRLWDVNEPNLYDLKLALVQEGTVIDAVESYFGLRSIYVKDHAIWLNGRPLFQRLVLDQGFYPDGIYTAPTDAALQRDIELSMQLGFNGARLHEKAFEERFLYHADRLGYLVWGEHANWGLDISTADGLARFLPEWLELVERDFNHPALIGWCPFNETWDQAGRRQENAVLRNVYLATKAADPTRPVIDTSGNYHVITDIYDVHDYDQNVASFTKKYGYLRKGEAYETNPRRQQFGGQPYFVSEYGGARWNPAAVKHTNAQENSWGYGEAPKSEAEFSARYEGLTDALTQSEGVCAFCYTQLYDIEQEQNGLYTYTREPKFSTETYEIIRRANTRKAAIEA